MDYQATEISNLTFSQIDSITDEIELLSLKNMIYYHPLIFVKKEHSIIFFNFRVILDQIHYDVLFELVRNATKMNQEKGLSALELFKLAKCKHTKEISRNNLTEEQRADERIRDIKRKIKNTVKKSYIEIENKYKTVKNTSCIGITTINVKFGQKKIFCEDLEIDENSPYYNFEIESALNSLIINQRDKLKKYSTEFHFSS